MHKNVLICQCFNVSICVYTIFFMLIHTTYIDSYTLWFAHFENHIKNWKVKCYSISAIINHTIWNSLTLYKILNGFSFHQNFDHWYSFQLVLTCHDCMPDLIFHYYISLVSILNSLARTHTSLHFTTVTSTFSLVWISLTPHLFIRHV